jgi:hypothetical protein
VRWLWKSAEEVNEGEMKKNKGRPNWWLRKGWPIKFGEMKKCLGRRPGGAKNGTTRCLVCLVHFSFGVSEDEHKI